MRQESMFIDCGCMTTCTIASSATHHSGDGSRTLLALENGGDAQIGAIVLDKDGIRHEFNQAQKVGLVLRGNWEAANLRRLIAWAAVKLEEIIDANQKDEVPVVAGDPTADPDFASPYKGAQA
jgi:hypothetical protein